MNAAASHSASQSSSAAKKSPSDDVFHGLRCVPSRRSVKFTATSQARHFLAFDTSISREERLIFFMELFVFRHLLADAELLPDFQQTTYTPEELLDVRVVTDPRHPAYGQAGLYAKSAIPHNTIVTPYSGFIEVFATSCNSRTYTMGFGSLGDDYALDAEFVGNYGRFANDPRGVGTLQANLSAENRFNSRGESFTALVARRQISAGEEILMSYGKAHRLSATPWTTMQGEPLMRPRMGGVIPFPTFRTTAPASAAVNAGAAGQEPRQGEARSRLQFVQETASGTAQSDAIDQRGALEACVRTPAESGATEPALGRKEQCDGSATPPPDSVAHDLLWECTQCGMWTLCEASLADTPQLCAKCKTPKLSGARMVSLLSSPAVTQEELLREAGMTPAVNNAACEDGTASATLVTPSPTQHSSASSSTAAGTATVFSSEHADWPMSVPFLPWQVWDAAVPLSVLAKHSRFESQGHMFLYTVDTGLKEEHKHHRRHHTRDGASEETDEPSMAPRRSVKRERDTSDGEEEEEDSSTDSTSEPSPPQHPLSHSGPSTRADENTCRRIGSTGRHKRGPLWERQGDVGAEELAQLHSSLVSVAAAPPTRSPAPFSASFSRASDEASPASAPTHPYQLPARKVATPDDDSRKEDLADMPTESEDTGSNSNPGDRRLRTTPPAVSATVVRPPLSFLLTATQDVDRLVPLRRPSCHAMCPTLSNASLFALSPQMTAVRRRLQCMTRRLFTGRPFQAGEVVSYVGGLVRQRGDSRCRAADSCLEIPLRFFLPPLLRGLCDRSNGVSGIPATRAGSGTALQQFCRHVDSLSLIVTNEFMYCPCLVVEEQEGEASATVMRSAPEVAREVDEVDSALKACNVALVLTLDSLGCPYACAVATKPIAAFEPLLARAQ